MKGLIKYIHDDFDDWMRDPLYHGGIIEDIIISVLAVIGLVIVIMLAKA